jgi:hypothetical protein
MVHGRVVRPPRYGARLDDIGETAARAVPGVVAVVRDGSFLGVVAEREEQAVKARDALIRAAKWSDGSELPDPARLHDDLMALPTQSSVVGEKQASVTPAAQTLEATYTRPYIAHPSIGPSCAVAEYKDGTLTVWTHSHGVFPRRRDLAKALKLDVDAVRCVHLEGSGCYGHNGSDDVAVDAALLGRAVAGRPVRLQWMRDDEFGWEPYGSAMLARAKASLDANGRVVDWVYFALRYILRLRSCKPMDAFVISSLPSALHPLESAALSRRTPIAVVEAAFASRRTALAPLRLARGVRGQRTAGRSWGPLSGNQCIICVDTRPRGPSPRKSLKWETRQKR